MSRRLLVLSLIIFLTVLPVRLGFAESTPDGIELAGCITMLDENDKIIMQTGLSVRVGDEFIDEDDSAYEVIAVENNIARAHRIASSPMVFDESAVITVQAPANLPTQDTMPTEQQPQSIAIYHTHTDEGYIPNDGKPTENGNGSIMLVGEAFAQRLAELGYNPIHSKTLHDPHDANAYQRSRRTFTQLLGQKPAALFDVHRDSAPLNIYKATIEGKDTAKILLVVGKQNQNRATTLNYAKQIKREADKKYKGLVRGIFMAHGNYNQDLNPRAMLIEVGTQYNNREAAEHSVALFADIIPSLIAPKTGTPGEVAGPVDTGSDEPPATSRNYAYDALIMLGAVVFGVIAYLYLSTGSWQEAKNKLKRFRRYEFGNFFGSGKKRK